MSLKTKTKEKFINVGIVYNAFDPTDVKRDKILWRRNTQLKTYLKGLPKEVEWKIAVNGRPVDLIDDAKMRLQANDNLTLVVVPQGGGGAKNILRMIALVAVAVVAWYAAPYVLGAMGVTATTLSLGLTAGILTMAGGLLVNLLLPPTMPKFKEDNDSQSYGYDGAKNTVKEGVALPTIYGEYRVAGNYIDLYTENVGDDQYINARVALSDGIIDSVLEPEITEQPITNYTNIEWGYTKGQPSESINPYFGRSIAQVQSGAKLSTSYFNYTTTGPVDRIQINILFPAGLAHIKKSGSKEYKSVSLEAQYKPTSSSTWINFNSNAWKTASLVSPTPTTTKLRVVYMPTLLSPVNQVGAVNYNIEYKKVGDSTWTSVASDAGQSAAALFARDSAAGGWGDTYVGGFAVMAYSNSKVVEISVPTGQYEVRATNATIQNIQYETSIQSDGLITYSNNKTKAMRRSFETSTLPYDTYDIRIRRTTPEGTDEYEVDQCYVNDIGEITTLGVPLNHIATAWYRVKMTDQLSGIPNVTWKVKGVKVNKYDYNGNIIVKEWSDNPAWIVLDMLVGEERGNTSVYKIDFPSFVEWAEHCDTTGLKFNGVFDTTESLWDACQSVLKVGRATFTRIGTKLGVAVDKAAQPVMLFGPGNIFSGSFNIEYVGMEDRANEFEVSYFDKDDRNKQKTVRIVDPDAENKGLPPRPVSYSLFGVTNHTQALNEAWYQLYCNRYQRRIITFDVPVESLGLGIGEVALVQHDIVNWGVSGRLGTSTSTSQITLDRPVNMETGKDYSILVIHDKLVRATGVAAGVTSNTITITGVTNTSITAENVKRIYQPSTGTDREVVDISFVLDTAYVVFRGSNVGFDNTTIEFVDTDVIEEKNVVFQSGERTTVLTISPFSQIPSKYSNFMFGERTVVKKPYRLRAISGTGFDRRTVTMIEYNEAIYNPPESIVPQPPTSQPIYPSHVKSLIYTYDLRITDGSTRVSGVVSWQAGHILNYGGADIYTSINGSEYVFNKTVMNATEAQLNFSRGDNIGVKVVAFSTSLLRANPNTAPYIEQTLETGPIALDPPVNITINLFSFLVLASVDVSWSPPAENAGDKYRVQVKRAGAATWDQYAVTTETYIRISDLPVGNHRIRIRSEDNQSISVWNETDLIVETPGLQTAITGLKLGVNGTPNASSASFTTQNADFYWENYNIYSGSGTDYYFLDYEVTIKDATTDAVVRTEYVQDPHYVYTFEKNDQDTPVSGGVVARRSFKIEVRARGRMGQVSEPAVMVANNAIPAAPVRLDIVPGVGNIAVTVVPPANTSDIAGYAVWVSDTPNPSESNFTKQYKGAGDTFIFEAENNITYYIKGSTYDKFGYTLTSWNLSSEYSASGVVIQIEDTEWFATEITLTPNASTNTVSWNAGGIREVANGVETVYDVPAGSAVWGGQPVYIYFDKATPTIIQASTNINDATVQSGVILGIYSGGTNLSLGERLGAAIIDGGRILARTIGANQLSTGLLITETAQIGNGIITNAKIDNIIQSTNWNPTTKQGWRINKSGDIEGNSIKIYDNTGNVVFSSGGVDWSFITNIPNNVGGTTNMLDMSAWVARNGDGLTNWGPWVFNGAGSEQQIVTDIAGPLGVSEPIWKATAGRNGATVNNQDGGWEYTLTSSEGYDATKSYRYSVWVYRDSLASGSIYHGPGPNQVKNISGVVQVEPYFFNTSGYTGQWYLMVGVIHGSSYTGSDSGITGLYDPRTGKKVVNGQDFISVSGAIEQKIRSYQYYSSTGSVTLWARPMFEEINGSETPLLSLLNYKPTESNLPTFVSVANTTILGNSVKKTSGGDLVWNAAARSIENYSSGAGFSFVAPNISTIYMIGLSNEGQLPDVNYTSIKYAIYCHTGSLYFYKDGVNVASLGAYQAGDILSGYHNGLQFTIRKNGIVIGSWNYTDSTQLYLDTSIYTLNASINDIKFGPYPISGNYGALAGQNTADWQTQITGVGKPENNATNGATIGSNLFGTFTSGNISTYINSALITNAMIVNLDAAKISTGFLNADRIQAGTLDANKLKASNVTVSLGLGTSGKIVLDGPNNRIIISD